MKRMIWIILVIVSVFLYACGSKAKSIHSFVGVFTTENGVKFELRADSTTLITFSDSVMYEGTWKFAKLKIIGSMPILSLEAIRNTII